MIIEPGTVIYDESQAEYEVLEFIGSGAFGSVYRLRRKSDNSDWAVKALSPFYQNRTVLKGLINEGNLATKVRHENVIEYAFFHDGTAFDGLPPYIIMEFADQGNLKEIIQNQKKENEFIENDELGQYIRQLVDGMEAINAVLVHRDIKPDNILVKGGLIFPR